MRELKILTGLMYLGIAGVAVSLGGGIYAAIREHREAAKPQALVFPTPASGAGGMVPVHRSEGGGLPTPAH